jgi:hypothetical protein
VSNVFYCPPTEDLWCPACGEVHGPRRVAVAVTRQQFVTVTVDAPDEIVDELAWHDRLSELVWGRIEALADNRTADGWETDSTDESIVGVGWIESVSC